MIPLPAVALGMLLVTAVAFLALVAVAWLVCGRRQ